MTARVSAALTIVQFVAARADPTVPVPVGTIAGELGTSLSRASRLCSELLELGLLEHGRDYGSYFLGPQAVQLSGRAAAPYTKVLRHALTLVANQTAETVCLAARSGSSLRVVAAVESLWTLHAPAEIGDLIDERGAIGRAAGSHRPLPDVPDEPAETNVFEATLGSCVEIAAPVLGPDGESIAALGVRLPVYRLEQHGPSARRAVQTARRIIENAVAGQLLAAPDVAGPPAAPSTPTGLVAALRILHHLARTQDTVSGTARAVGLRPDRAQRLLESCEQAGLVVADAGRSRFRLSWSVHGWHRGVVAPVIVRSGSPLAAATAADTGTCVFITVLRGMRSLTLVEHLSTPAPGLRMSPWLGRAHPIIGSDGGPVLVMDLEMHEIAELFPPRYTRLELDRFLRRVRQVVQDDVISMEPFDHTGMQSVSAPVRDSSGAVVAAACLVATTEYFTSNGERSESAVRKLAADVSALLGHRPGLDGGRTQRADLTLT